MRRRVVTVPRPAIVTIIAVVLVAPLLKLRWDLAVRVTKSVANIEIGAVATRNGLPSASIAAPVNLAGSLISRRDHSVGKTAAVNVDVISVPALLLHLDRRSCVARQGRAKLKTDYSSGKNS